MTAETPAGTAERCPIACDDDCESECHAAHQASHKRDHELEDCPAADRTDWGSPFLNWTIRRLKTERDAAITRAEQAEAEVQRYRSFCGEALCGDVERDRDRLQAAIDRTTNRMTEYHQHGSRMVNVRQVINLLSPTWPDGNYSNEGGDRG